MDGRSPLKIHVNTLSLKTAIRIGTCGKIKFRESGGGLRPPPLSLNFIFPPVPDLDLDDIYKYQGQDQKTGGFKPPALN